MQVGVQLCDTHLMSDIITLKNNDDDEVTFTPSAFLLLPLFPPERGMRTKREREAAESGRKEQKQQTGETASYPGPLPTCPSAGGLIAAQTEDSGSHVGVKILRLPAADSGSSRRDMWVAQ